MAGNLSPEEVREALTQTAPLSDPFSLLRSIGTFVSFAPDAAARHEARDLVILMLDRRGELNGYSRVLDSLAVAAGLYPYASPEGLSTAELLEYEAHRPIGMPDTVFHQVQAIVYNALMDGESVVLSAPTSFGKSLIIDALIASGKFRNLAIVVPTIALIDETRRRLAGQFKDDFKIVTHPSQQLAQRNLIVMTQERILDLEALPPLDLFIIDEFYKLDPSGDRDRANLLNQAFYRLKRTGAQFYLLGPNIERTPVELNEIARVVVTDFSTVSLDVRRVQPPKGAEEQALVELSHRLQDPTLIYCRSPQQARDVAKALIAASVSPQTDSLDAAIEWIGENYHPDWSFVQAIRHGVGIHHGRIPRALGQFAVRAFNNGDLRFLVCTSTLIEGVNTTAKNVIVYDNKIANQRYDFFTFNNIKGRSGRMFSHFVGHVYLFHEPPRERLRSVDVPALTQPADTDKSLLIQIEESDLNEESRASIADLFQQQELPLDDLRKSSGVDPEQLVALARRLRNESNLVRALGWSGYPTGSNLTTTCGVIWNDLGGRRFSSSYVRTARQLAFRLQRLRVEGIRGLIESEIREGEEPDSAVEEVLYFVRQWAGFHFPRLVAALERTQRRVAEELGMPLASFGFFASQVESLFRPKALSALEEYGIPLQLGERLHTILDLNTSVDDAIDRLRGLELATLEVSPFERQLLEEALVYL